MHTRPTFETFESQGKRSLGDAAISIDDRRLKRLTSLAIHSLDADIGGISIVHSDRIWLPSHVGPVKSVIETSGSFCSSAVQAKERWFEVADACVTEEFAHNPLVELGEFRHYAAVPLLLGSAPLQGTLWVMRKQAGHMTLAQRQALIDLADLATEALEVRYFDEITGMCNRTFFEHQLQSLMDAGLMHVTVGYINIKAFNQLRAALGEDSSQTLVRTIGERLRSWAGGGALVSHLGGDRFAFALFSGSAAADDRTDALTHILQMPVELPGGRDHWPRIRIGVKRGALNGQTASELLQNANSAAQACRGWSVREYDTVHFDEAKLLSELCKVVRNDEEFGALEVQYQPQVDVSRRAIVGWEALVRWRHPQYGLILPGAFIPLAEQAGEIASLDILVLKQVCKDLRGWLDLGLPVKPVALNFSRDTLFHTDLMHSVITVMEQYEISGEYLECEVTETQCSDLSSLAKVLTGFRELNWRIAIDDFGTGYANLETVRQIPCDRIKIDRQFVHGVSCNPILAGLMRTLGDIAKLFQLELLCEGVEEAADVRWLSEHDLPLIQGWYFGKAMPSIKVIQLLGSSAPTSAENFTLHELIANTR